MLSWKEFQDFLKCKYSWYMQLMYGSSLPTAALHPADPICRKPRYFLNAKNLLCLYYKSECNSWIHSLKKGHLISTISPKYLLLDWPQIDSNKYLGLKQSWGRLAAWQSKQEPNSYLAWISTAMGHHCHFPSEWNTARHHRFPHSWGRSKQMSMGPNCTGSWSLIQALPGCCKITLTSTGSSQLL